MFSLETLEDDLDISLDLNDHCVALNGVKYRSDDDEDEIKQMDARYLFDMLNDMKDTIRNLRVYQREMKRRIDELSRVEPQFPRVKHI